MLNNSFIQFLENNQGAISLIKNSEHHSRIKHIDVQYHYVREIAKDDLIKSSYVPISDIIADIFTKSIKSAIFLHFRNKLDLTKVSF